MKFFIKLVPLLLILIMGIACSGPNEVQGIPIPFNSGMVRSQDAAGVEITFYFDYPSEGRGDIVFRNLSSDPIKLKVTNLENGQTLVDDFILTFPGNADGINDPALFDQGDGIKIEVWIGYTAIYYSRYGWPASFKGTATLQEGTIFVSGTSDETQWSVPLPQTKGVRCELAGERPPSEPLNQTNTTFFCENVSSDTVRVELLVLTNNGNGTYDIDFELASFWMTAQFGDDADIAAVNYVISASEILAVRVNVYDPFDLDNWISQGNIVFTVDVATQSFTTLGVNATLIE